MNVAAATQDVNRRGVRCCARCAHYNEYDHDLGAEWYCANAEIDLELDEQPYCRVYEDLGCTGWSQLST